MQLFSAVVHGPLFSWLAAALVGAVLFFFFWWRAGSFFSVLDRCWRLIAGKADLNDPILNALVQESLDLEKFQLMFGVKAPTIADVHQFAAWRKLNRVSMISIHRARRWIDVTSLEVVRQPPKHYVGRRLTVALMALLCIAGMGQLAASRNAYLQMRDSKVWFKTDAVNVMALSGNWSFDRVKCETGRSDLMRLTGFNPSEVDAICDSLAQDDLKALVTKTLGEQATIAGWFALVALLVMLISFYSALGAEEAHSLRKRLRPA